MTKHKLINETPANLRRKIQLANDAYAKGVPFLTDYEYDLVWKQLYAIDPTNDALYHTARHEARDGYVKHQVPLLSLQKAFVTDDLKLFWQRYQDKDLLLQPKYDGVAICLYQMRQGIRAVLAGDGQGGLDVTRHIPYMQLPAVTGPRFECEALILWQDWQQSYGANPRNTVAGLLNRKTLEDNKIPIKVVPHNSLSLPLRYQNLNDLNDALLATYAEWAKTYPMDGLVIKVASATLRLQAGHNGKFPLWAIAWKPPIQTAESVVTSIEWNISKTGRLIPTIIYEAVQLCYTSNTRATGNNAKWIKDRNIGPGAKIRVGKAGEIIPQVVEVISGSSDTQLPEVCPMCNTELAYQEPHLVCEASDCVPQLAKQLLFFYSSAGLDIKSIGPALIDQLVQDETLYHLLKETRWALLEPDTFDISEKLRKLLSPGTYEKLLDSVMALDLELDPAKFIGGLGYKTLGSKRALVLLQLMKGYNPSKIKISRDSLCLMPLAVADLLRAKQQLKHFTVKEVPKPAKVTYCITGELSEPRQEIIRLLEPYGWQFTNYVGKELTYMVVGHLDHETYKLTRAKAYGIKQITEDDLPTNRSLSCE